VYQTDFDAFKKTVNDLCVSVNRPFNDDLVRVFWDDLKAVPLGQVQFRAKLLRTTGKTKFTSNDLRPEPEAVVHRPVDGGPTVEDRLTAFVLRNYSLTPAQLRGPWSFLGKFFDGLDPSGKMRHNHGCEVTGVVIPADGDSPSRRVMVEDMQLDAAA
jgi:hypothetical protein